MSYILSIDQGTTSTRVILFDKYSQIVCISQRKHEQISSQPGFLEHSPEEIYGKVVLCMTDVAQQMQRRHIDISLIRCCGITCQRETVVVWDRETGVPLCNAIVWSDVRNAELLKEVQTNLESEKIDIQQRTGLPISTYFSASKILWLARNDEMVAAAMRSKTCCIGTVDSWLLFKLTQYNREGPVFKTDVTNASRTQLFDLEQMQWADDLLRVFEVPKECLAQIQPSSSYFGEISIRPFQGIQITGIAGDQQASLFGHCCFEQNQSKCTFGTGAFLLTNIGNTPVINNKGLLTTVGFQLDGQKPFFAQEGSVNAAGAALEWLVKLHLTTDIKNLDNMISCEQNKSNGVIFVPAFSGLFCPYWRPDARGVILGLTLGTSSANIMCAALEAIALQVHDILEVLKKEGVETTVMAVDGGIVNSIHFRQILSNIIQAKVELRDMVEVTALGAALLAGLQAGMYENLEEIKKCVKEEVKVIDYQADEKEYCDKLKIKWQNSIQRALNLSE